MGFCVSQKIITTCFCTCWQFLTLNLYCQFCFWNECFFWKIQWLIKTILHRLIHYQNNCPGLSKYSYEYFPELLVRKADLGFVQIPAGARCAYSSLSSMHSQGPPSSHIYCPSYLSIRCQWGFDYAFPKAHCSIISSSLN